MTATNVLDDLRLVKTREVTERLDISERQLRRLVTEGVLRPVRLRRGGNLRFRLRDVVALVEEGGDNDA